MKRKSILFALLLVFTLTVMLPAATANWIDDAVAAWGDLLPDADPTAPITRAEFAGVLNGVLGFPAADSPFTDIAGNPFEDDINALYGALVTTGMTATTFGPDLLITREQVAAMIFRAFALTQGEELVAPDADEVSDYALGYISALYDNGIWEGGTDGAVMPKKTFTVAEAFKTIDNASSGGNTLITKSEVIANKTLGNVFIAPSVGDGEVIFDNVTIGGTLFVRGGGADSIVFKGNSVVGRVIVDKVGDGSIRIASEGNALINAIVINDGSDSIIIEGNVGTLVIDASVEVVIKGDVDNVVITAPAVSLEVAEDASVGEVIVAAAAVGAEIVNNGAIAELAVAAADTAVDNQGSIASAVIPESVTVTGTAPEEVSNDTSSINDVYN